MFQYLPALFYKVIEHFMKSFMLQDNFDKSMHYLVKPPNFILIFFNNKKINYIKYIVTQKNV